VGDNVHGALQAIGENNNLLPWSSTTSLTPGQNSSPQDAITAPDLVSPEVLRFEIGKTHLDQSAACDSKPGRFASLPLFSRKQD
jgi:hypothetical protein